MTDIPDFGTFGRFVETPFSEMSADMRDAYDFTTKLRGQVPGPHKIWLSKPKLSKVAGRGHRRPEKGEPAAGLSSKEQLAQRFAREITANRRVGDALYGEAYAAFGPQAGSTCCSWRAVTIRSPCC